MELKPKMQRFNSSNSLKPQCKHQKIFNIRPFENKKIKLLCIIKNYNCQ